MSKQAAERGFWARCSGCGHCWIAAYYPLELALFARIALRHHRCPKCDAPGVVAQQNDGVLQEPGDG